MTRGKSERQLRKELADIRDAMIILEARARTINRALRAEKQKVRTRRAARALPLTIPGALRSVN